jgi:hypothetical protein
MRQWYFRSLHCRLSLSAVCDSPQRWRPPRVEVVPDQTHPDKESELRKYPRNLNLELLVVGELLKTQKFSQQQDQ